MNKYLLALLSSLTFLGSMHSVAAQASDWTYVTSSVSDDDYYINAGSMKKRSDYAVLLLAGSSSPISASDHIEAWWKVVSKDDSYIQINSRFYCNKGLSIDTSMVSYSASNTYINSPTPSRYASPKIPGTSFAKIYDFVCN